MHALCEGLQRRAPAALSGHDVESGLRVGRTATQYGPLGLAYWHGDRFARLLSAFEQAAARTVECVTRGLARALIVRTRAGAASGRVLVEV